MHRRLPASWDELGGARDDAIEVDEQVQREDGDDERAERHRDVAERPEEREGDGVERARQRLSEPAAEGLDELAHRVRDVDAERLEEPRVEPLLQHAELLGELRRRGAHLIGEHRDAVDDEEHEP